MNMQELFESLKPTPGVPPKMGTQQSFDRLAALLHQTQAKLAGAMSVPPSMLTPEGPIPEPEPVEKDGTIQVKDGRG
jgi:hypothetical protein